MALTVKWNSGILIESDGERIIFDPRRRERDCSHIFVTHAHLDHSKGLRFHDVEKSSTRETGEIASRYGRLTRWRPLPYGEKVEVGGLEVEAHNAGHVLGSASYEVSTSDGRLLYTGDMQFKDTLTLKAAEPVDCDVLVIEATFGSPFFKFPERGEIVRDMVEWAFKTVRDGRIPTFRTDSLGNAQEIVRAFNMLTNLPVVVHRRIAEINQVYEEHGISLEFLISGSEEAREVEASGECILIIPKNLKVDDPRFKVALVSGWSLLYGGRRGDSFPLSDHADFNQLIEFIEACKPRVVLTCFGGRFNRVLAQQVEKRMGIEARPLDLIPTVFI